MMPTKSSLSMTKIMRIGSYNDVIVVIFQCIPSVAFKISNTCWILQKVGVQSYLYGVDGAEGIRWTAEGGSEPLNEPKEVTTQILLAAARADEHTVCDCFLTSPWVPSIHTPPSNKSCICSASTKSAYASSIRMYFAQQYNLNSLYTNKARIFWNGGYSELERLTIHGRL